MINAQGFQLICIISPHILTSNKGERNHYSRAARFQCPLNKIRLRTRSSHGRWSSVSAKSIDQGASATIRFIIILLRGRQCLDARVCVTFDIIKGMRFSPSQSIDTAALRSPAIIIEHDDCYRLQPVPCV